MDSLIFFFSALGVFNGVLLSFYLFFFTKEKSLSKYLLGALVLSLSIRIGKSIILYFDNDVHKFVLQVGLSACLFIGPFLYFYLRAALEQTEEFPKRWKWSLLILFATIIIIGAIRPYHTDPAFWNTYVVQSIYLVWFLSVLAAGFVLIPKVVMSYKANQELSPALKWLSAIYLGNVIIALAFFLSFFGFSSVYYITGPMVFSFFLYLVAFGYYNDQWFDISTKQPIEKYSNKKIEAQDAKKLLRELNSLMEDEKIFVNQDLKLKDVADQLNISSHQLSQFVNDNLGKGFKSYINEHRIEAACKIMSTKHHLSLEGVGYEVGFKSKSTFFTTFKKLKQLTPLQYQEQKV